MDGTLKFWLMRLAPRPVVKNSLNRWSVRVRRGPGAAARETSGWGFLLFCAPVKKKKTIIINNNISERARRALVRVERDKQTHPPYLPLTRSPPFEFVFFFLLFFGLSQKTSAAATSKILHQLRPPTPSRPLDYRVQSMRRGLFVAIFA